MTPYVLGWPVGVPESEEDEPLVAGGVGEGVGAGVGARTAGASDSPGMYVYCRIIHVA